MMMTGSELNVRVGRSGGDRHVMLWFGLLPGCARCKADDDCYAIKSRGRREGIYGGDSLENSLEQKYNPSNLTRRN
jgi:hypothetical protein